MGRAPCCDKANVKKGPWSPEEDAKLKDFIQDHGTLGNWIALPQKIGLKRCGKSCRLRWLNYLRPNIKHGGFSEEEDNIICNLYISIGSRWSVIAAQLPGRTDNDIKNYWNTRLKKKLLGKRKQSNYNGIISPSSNPNDNQDPKDQVLSNSALERLQLHMQLQGIDQLWPQLHPMQEKLVQTFQALNNNNNHNQNPNFLNPNFQALIQQPKAADNFNIQPIIPYEIPSSNLSSDGHHDQVSNFKQMDEFLNDKEAEFDCFKEVGGSDSSKDNLIWWATTDHQNNEHDHMRRSSSSSNSWDSSSVLQSELVMFQDFDLGYNL